MHVYDRLSFTRRPLYFETVNLKIAKNEYSHNSKDETIAYVQ